LLFRHAPGPSFRAMELLLGRISSLSETGNFTTQGSDMDKRTADERDEAVPNV
jgi:hypothetical protein